MRAAFTLSILCLAAFYTALAFSELNFLSSLGRIGPGFFPRIIGVLLILACCYSLYFDLKQRHQEEAISSYWTVVVVVAICSGLFVVAIQVLGGLLGMILFLLATLLFLNRGHPVQNVLIAGLLPVAVYVLFRVWLNAAMPDGMLGLPI